MGYTHTHAVLSQAGAGAMSPAANLATAVLTTRVCAWEAGPEELSLHGLAKSVPVPAGLVGPASSAKMSHLSLIIQDW